MASFRPRLRPAPQRAELERLGGPPGWVLRPVRNGQDGIEGERREVHRVRGRQLRGDLQSDGQ